MQRNRNQWMRGGKRCRETERKGGLDIEVGMNGEGDPPRSGSKGEMRLEDGCLAALAHLSSVSQGGSERPVHSLYNWGGSSVSRPWLQPFSPACPLGFWSQGRPGSPLTSPSPLPPLLCPDITSFLITVCVSLQFILNKHKKP